MHAPGWVGSDRLLRAPSAKGDWRSCALRAVADVTGSDLRLTSSKEDVFMSARMS